MNPKTREKAKEIVVNSLGAIIIGVLCYAWIIICACL